MDAKVFGAAAITAAVVAGGAFYGGTQYAKADSPSRNIPGEVRGGQFMRNGQGGPGGQGMRGGAGMGGFTAGEIIGRDDMSITVKLQDGGSRIVLLSASTTIAKSAPGTLDDLAQGANVVITGMPNQDGSITARSVQLGGEMRFGPGAN